MNGHWNSASIGQLDDQVIGFVAAPRADRRLGQLRQADRQVDVGPRVVHAPAAAVAVAIAAERDAAELERAVEVFGRGRTDTEPAASAAASLPLTRLDREQRKLAHDESSPVSARAGATARNRRARL